MTAANIWLSDDRAAVYTDGAWTQADGIVDAIAPKVLLLPHLNGCMVMRGDSRIVFAFNTLMPAMCATFDDLAEAIPYIALNPPPDLQPLLGPASIGTWQMTLVGYSEAAQAFRGFLFQTVHGAHGPEVKTETFTRMLTPSDDALLAECEPLEHDPGPERAAEIMERQRQIVSPIGNGGQGIVTGGFCQRTLITPESITTMIVRRWNDEPGKRVTL